MKALSIRQPYADQILHGQKTKEYRSWPTNHRGDLLICATAKKCDDLPTGVAVCIAKVIDCKPDPAGGFAWSLEDVRPVTGFPVKGRLGLFDVNYPPSSDQRPSNAGGTRSANSAGHGTQRRERAVKPATTSAEPVVKLPCEKVDSSIVYDMLILAANLADKTADDFMKAFRQCATPTQRKRRGYSKGQKTFIILKQELLRQLPRQR